MSHYLVQEHIFDKYLRPERLPHVWCAGCGIGAALACYLNALEDLAVDIDKSVMVSGIGCSSRAPGYMNMDSFHVTHGRALPFAIGLKLAKPELSVTVFAGDGDLFAIGGNHFVHTARRNFDIKVICINNFNYGMTGGQSGPTTPLDAWTTTTPYGNVEFPLNLPYFAAACGAVYVARWTTLDVRRLRESIGEALAKKGFCFIEVISPCPIAYGRWNEMPEGLDMMKYFKEHSEIRHGLQDLSQAMIEKGGKIILGKFIDTERETFEDRIGRIVRRREKG